MILTTLEIATVMTSKFSVFSISKRKRGRSRRAQGVCCLWQEIQRRKRVGVTKLGPLGIRGERIVLNMSGVDDVQMKEETSLLLFDKHAEAKVIYMHLMTDLQNPLPNQHL